MAAVRTSSSRANRAKRYPSLRLVSDIAPDTLEIRGAPM
jgi:hypothetical protein